MKTTFSIGETAKINNISIQALRHYDKIGLLKPVIVNEENGYRYYSVEQFIYIDIIKHAKAFGIPLKELTETLTTGNMIQISTKVKHYKDDLEHQIQSLIRAKNKFSRVAEMIEYSLTAVQNQTPYQRKCEERNIIKLRNQKEVRNFEINSRMIEGNTQQSGLEFAFESGYFVDLSSFIHNGVESYTSAYLAMFVDNAAFPFSESEYVVSTIPQGEYVCITYNPQNKDERIKQIHNYLKTNKIKTELILVAELYDDFKNQSKEIQVLVNPD
ncbi:MerR family transcriptional regulator [Halomonas sp. ISL-60]|nr:MerR family transcriptional regulator [Halomonas sp. ISL-60]